MTAFALAPNWAGFGASGLAACVSRCNSDVSASPPSPTAQSRKKWRRVWCRTGSSMAEAAGRSPLVYPARATMANPASATMANPARQGGVLAPLAGMYTPALTGGVRPEQPLRVGRGLCRQLLEWHAADLGDESRSVGDEGGLVALAAQRDRGEIRAVGFDQDPIRGHFRGDGAQLAGVLVGHHAGER